MGTKTVSAPALQFAHDEVLRIRASLSASMVNVQSRAVALFGVGALAAALAGVSSTNPFWWASVTFFFIAALAGAGAMAPRKGIVQSPEKILKDASDKTALDFQRELVNGLLAECKTYMKSVKHQSFWLNVGIISFVVAVVSLVVTRLAV
ncbi:hypothetical protein [Clavibacter michiganensis]|uniref:hypothetical protein n=1 Tax=Clavibacter michiganensis TaxID=28447 RepID=UPI0010555AA4|nr:hypothetical protein [Clavibacter michiganensis]